MLARQETAALAERLLADSIRKQGVDRDQLAIHPKIASGTNRLGWRVKPIY